MNQIKDMLEIGKKNLKTIIFYGKLRPQKNFLLKIIHLIFIQLVMELEMLLTLTLCFKEKLIEF